MRTLDYCPCNLFKQTMHHNLFSACKLLLLVGTANHEARFPGALLTHDRVDVWEFFCLLSMTLSKTLNVFKIITLSTVCVFKIIVMLWNFYFLKVFILFTNFLYHTNFSTTVEKNIDFSKCERLCLNINTFTFLNFRIILHSDRIKV